MNKDELYIQRCLQLAQLGAGQVAPNPMVGSVLVHNDRIIGEGFHAKYGQAHAEVNCIASVAESDQHLISQSTIYVSLEPCAHFGKTPPCCDLIIKNNIPKVVIACRDSFEKVNGEGVRKLRDAGIEVTEAVLEKQALDINRRFFTFNNYKRPYIILKWAQSGNGRIAAADYSPVKISNTLTDKEVHKWRSEEAAILAGTRTVLKDNPALTDRLWGGNHQLVRIVIDEQLVLPGDLKLFDGSTPTVVINRKKESVDGNTTYLKIDDNKSILQGLCSFLYERRLNSLIVEGGAKTLQSFIDAGLWDEARIITNGDLVIENGIAAPAFNNNHLILTTQILSDTIRIYRNIDPGKQ